LLGCSGYADWGAGSVPIETRPIRGITRRCCARGERPCPISLATARGWISDAAGWTISQVVEQLLGLLAAFTPALYAAAKIDNSRRT
jgi:hypothetical protein